MKTISKILLPLGTIAATATAVTPLVACGSKDEWANAVDLLKFKPDPTTKYKHDGTISNDDACNELFGSENAISNIEQDIYEYLVWQAENELPWIIWLLDMTWVGDVKEASGSLSNLDLKYDKSKHLATLTGVIRLKATCEMVDSAKKKIGTYTIETKHDIHNMPYHVVWRVTEAYPNGYWPTYFAPSELKDDHEWYVDRSYEGKAIYDKAGVPSEESSSFYKYSYLNTYTNEASVDPISAANYEELSMIRWWSYHLSDVKGQI